MKILYSVHYKSQDPFGLFNTVVTVKNANQLVENNGILLLHGGEDISPSIYNAKCNKYCHAGLLPSERDLLELSTINRARKLGMPIIGICRGAQLLCAVDGGTLLQHMTNHHGGSHEIIDMESGLVFRTNSAHHQMMLPQKHNQILAKYPAQVLGYDENDNLISYPDGPEIVWFPKLKGLGIQGHPEWVDKSTIFHQMCVNYIQTHILGGK